MQEKKQDRLQLDELMMSNKPTNSRNKESKETTK
jgi:hypothetical protein